MPLLKRKSQKAFEHNLKAEMHAGKPQPQALAIAYSVKRKAKKASGGTVESGSKDMNYADGGDVTDAKTQSRPMPSQTHDDAAMVRKNSAMKPPKDDSWTSTPTERQAKKGPKTTPIKHPKMVSQSAYSTRLRDEEDDLQATASPASPDEQPPEHDDEEYADRQGPPVPDMAEEHNNHRKPYAKGGEINKLVSMDEAEEDRVEHPTGLEEDDDQIGDEHAMDDHMQMLAEGGRAEADSMDEEDVAHAASIASAVMAKMRAEGRLDSGSEDEDEAAEDSGALGKTDSLFTFPRKKLARGGEILSEDSMETTDDDQADLARNAEEDANMEDKASFDALRKENYNESEGLRKLDQPRGSNLKGDSREDAEENDHDDDMVKAILKKMKSRSPMTR